MGFILALFLLYSGAFAHPAQEEKPMSNGQNSNSPFITVTQPQPYPFPTQPEPVFIPHPEQYAPLPAAEAQPKNILYPAVGAFFAVLIVGMLAFQQFEIGRLQQEVTVVKTDIAAVRRDISTTNRKADTALAAIRKVEALQEKVCTIPLIGGIICSWLGLQQPTP